VSVNTRVDAEKRSEGVGARNEHQLKEDCARRHTAVALRDVATLFREQ